MKSWIAALFALAATAAAQPVVNIKDYGASGRKTDNARPAIQQAIDACAKAGGGTVYVPPGEYTSGQLHMKSGVRLYVEAGATIFASMSGKEFDSEKTAALIYGEDLHNIAIEGRGTLDGQAVYEWRPNNFTDFYIMPNQRLMEATGKPLLRSFPVGMANNAVYPRLVLLLRSEDIRISGLKFLRSRSWTINPYACKRLTIDGVYIYSSQKEAVWADGIDPDGCQDVRISNSTVETGDDALVFYSADIWGPALPTENVTVTNCRFSSASSAIKFCDGNSNAVRRVAINNVVITNSNRGLAFMVFDGGIVEDVTISDVLIETRRFDWFWWGDGDPIHFNIKRRSEVDGTKRENEPKAGVIRNVSIRNVIAHGTGTSAINGHPDSWLDGIHLDNVHLFVSHDPNAPYENTRDAITLKHARNSSMHDVQIRWDKPEAATWQTGLRAENVQNLLLDSIDIANAPGSHGDTIELKDADGVTLRHSHAATIHVAGRHSRKINLSDTDSVMAWDKPPAGR
ncbi:MAG TPA: glycosyl hydrolase family 28 protein [Bryobacteraceae bacterium]|nr:glycosyl hydrolase family 28 protein [Bryobacteraceae bacterium]